MDVECLMAGKREREREMCIQVEIKALELDVGYVPILVGRQNGSRNRLRTALTCRPSQADKFATIKGAQALELSGQSPARSEITGLRVLPSKRAFSNAKRPNTPLFTFASLARFYLAQFETIAEIFRHKLSLYFIILIQYYKILSSCTVTTSIYQSVLTFDSFQLDTYDPAMFQHLYPFEKEFFWRCETQVFQRQYTPSLTPISACQ